VAMGNRRVQMAEVCFLALARDLSSTPFLDKSSFVAGLLDIPNSFSHRIGAQRISFFLAHSDQIEARQREPDQRAIRFAIVDPY
jgi:hypothetical protein